jgi:hypothetical protein
MMKRGRFAIFCSYDPATSVSRKSAFCFELPDESAFPCWLRKPGSKSRSWIEPHGGTVARGRDVYHEKGLRAFSRFERLGNQQRDLLVIGEGLAVSKTISHEINTCSKRRLVLRPQDLRGGCA